jgi:hypothetical protein
LDWNEVYALFTDLLIAGYDETLVRFLSSLVILEEIYGLTPEQTLRIWQENPYWQAFSGYQTLQFPAPVSPEEYGAFRKIAGKLRLQALSGMAPAFLDDSIHSEGSPGGRMVAPTLPSTDSSDIRRALLPNDPDQVSPEAILRKPAFRSEPHFDTLKPCLVDSESGGQVTLQVKPLGEGPFSFQWFRWSQLSRVQEIVPNAQNPTLVTREQPKPYYVAFRCVVKNSHCSEGRPSRWFFLRPLAEPALR